MLMNPRTYFTRVRTWLSGPPAPEAVKPTPTPENESPVTWSSESASSDEEINRASSQAFVAYELAMRCGHHPRLWNAVKGSPFQSLYERNLRVRSEAIALASDSP